MWINPSHSERLTHFWNNPWLFGQFSQLRLSFTGPAAASWSSDLSGVLRQRCRVRAWDELLAEFKSTEDDISYDDGFAWCVRNRKGDDADGVGTTVWSFRRMIEGGEGEVEGEGEELTRWEQDLRVGAQHVWYRLKRRRTAYRVLSSKGWGRGLEFS